MDGIADKGDPNYDSEADDHDNNYVLVSRAGFHDCADGMLFILGPADFGTKDGLDGGRILIVPAPSTTLCCSSLMYYAYVQGKVPRDACSFSFFSVPL